MTEVSSPYLAVYWGAKPAHSALVARLLATIGCPLIPLESEAEVCSYLSMDKRHAIILVDQPQLLMAPSISETIPRFAESAAVITLHEPGDGWHAVESLKAGALDSIFLEREQDQLCDRVSKVIMKFREILAVRQECRVVEAKICTLSPRERRVLRGILDGTSNKLMARAIEVTERAVEMRRAAIHKKLGCENTAQIIRLIIRWQLLSGQELETWLN